MMEKSKKVTTNLIWRFLERTGAQGVAFVVSIVLARLLDPTVYGTVALVTVFTDIVQVFVDSGLGSALIQKKDADDLDFSSVFYFNLVFCILLYTTMFFCAPFIANFYDKPELVSLTRVLSLTLVISGLKNVQQAYVARNMIFKKFFFATLAGTIGAAILGIWMAYRGYGVWALVAQNLFNKTVDTLLLWITVKWRPKLIFSFKRLKGLIGFGWKILLAALIDVIYRELRSLIIGKKYSSEDLAFYNKGSQFPKLIVTNINTSIDSVLFPTLSAAQENKSEVRSMTRRAIKTSTYIMMPLMVGLAVCADSIVVLILTEKWLPCVFFLRVFCFTYAFYPIHTANLNAIKAMGRSDLFLKLEIIKKIVGFVALVVTMFISVKAMALSLLVISIFSQLINSWPNRKLLDYSYIDQIKDMLPQIVLSCVMGGIVYCIGFLNLNVGLTLTLQVLTGVIIYFVGSKIMRIDSYDYIKQLISKYLRKAKANK